MLIRRDNSFPRGASCPQAAEISDPVLLQIVNRVIIADVNNGIIPFTGNQESSSNGEIEGECETQERALLYVAATRAKKEVIVTGFDKPSKFLR